MEIGSAGRKTRDDGSCSIELFAEESNVLLDRVVEGPKSVPTGDSLDDTVSNVEFKTWDGGNLHDIVADHTSGKVDYEVTDRDDEQHEGPKVALRSCGGSW